MSGCGSALPQAAAAQQRKHRRPAPLQGAVHGQGAASRALGDMTLLAAAPPAKCSRPHCPSSFTPVERKGAAAENNVQLPPLSSSFSPCYPLSSSPPSPPSPQLTPSEHDGLHRGEVDVGRQAVAEAAHLRAAQAGGVAAARGAAPRRHRARQRAVGHWATRAAWSRRLCCFCWRRPDCSWAVGRRRRYCFCCRRPACSRAAACCRCRACHAPAAARTRAAWRHQSRLATAATCCIPAPAAGPPGAACSRGPRADGSAAQRRCRRLGARRRGAQDWPAAFRVEVRHIGRLAGGVGRAGRRPEGCSGRCRRGRAGEGSHRCRGDLQGLRSCRGDRRECQAAQRVPLVRAPLPATPDWSREAPPGGFATRNDTPSSCAALLEAARD